MASTAGTIKRLVRDKGFGFVAAQDGTEYLLPPVRMSGRGLRHVAGRRLGDVREGTGTQGTAGREDQPRVNRVIGRPRRERAGDHLLSRCSVRLPPGDGRFILTTLCVKIPGTHAGHR